jgi:hypothetical protein
MTGNVLSGASDDCLTEGENEKVIVAKCAIESNAQVFGLPSGSLRHKNGTSMEAMASLRSRERLRCRHAESEPLPMR